MSSPYSKAPHLRPKSETALREWVDTKGASIFGLARELGRHPSQVRYWMNGQQLPTLVDAFLLERATNGGVPVASWLGTELAKWQASQRGTDWENLMELRSEERKRNGKRKS